jgi:hypothetical protein
MANIKRKTLQLSTGKQIKLYGNSIAIGKTLELGEGYAPNIFSVSQEPGLEKSSPAVINPHKLTAEELMEIADYNIRLWMELKDNIRQHGATSPKIFNADVGK